MLLSDLCDFNTRFMKTLLENDYSKNDVLALILVE